MKILLLSLLVSAFFAPNTMSVLPTIWENPTTSDQLKEVVTTMSFFENIFNVAKECEFLSNDEAKSILRPKSQRSHMIMDHLNDTERLGVDLAVEQACILRLKHITKNKVCIFQNKFAEIQKMIHSRRYNHRDEVLSKAFFVTLYLLSVTVPATVLSNLFNLRGNDLFASIFLAVTFCIVMIAEDIEHNENSVFEKLWWDLGAIPYKIAAYSSRNMIELQIAQCEKILSLLEEHKNVFLPD